MKPNKNHIYSLVIYALCFCGCREEILHGLSESEINQAIVRLEEGSIESSKTQNTDGTWSLEVSSGENLNALKILNDSYIVPKPDNTLSEGDSLMPSREDDLFRYERRISSSIEGTLKRIYGVLEARVHLKLSIPDQIFGASASKDISSGSVMLVVNQDFNTDSTQISTLVSGAAGIKIEGVSVLVTHIPNKIERSKVLPPPFTLLPTMYESWWFYGSLIGAIFAVMVLVKPRRLKALRDSTIWSQPNEA